MLSIDYAAVRRAIPMLRLRINQIIHCLKDIGITNPSLPLKSVFHLADLLRTTNRGPIGQEIVQLCLEGMLPASSLQRFSIRTRLNALERTINTSNLPKQLRRIVRSSEL